MPRPRTAVIAADHSRLSDAARDLLQVLGLLPQQEVRGKQLRPDVGAQAYDVGGGGGHEHWCWPHQQPAERCARDGLVSAQRVIVEGRGGRPEYLHGADGQPVLEVRPCEGVPTPRVADPAGDAVVAHEAFLEKVRAFATSEAIVIEHVGRMRALQRWFLKSDPLAESLEALAKANAVSCDRHLRFGFVRQARSKKGTRVRIGRTDRYVLDTPMRLCEWCEDVTEEELRLPTEREVKDNATGKRRKKFDENPARGRKGVSA